MKKILFLLFLLILSSGINAQHQATNSGNMRLHSGANLTFFGHFVNNGTFTDNGQLVTFAGSANQNISGTNAIVFNNCTVNNTAGVTLQRPVDVTNNLVLTNGALTLGNNTLTVANSATSAITRTNGFIVSEQTNNSGKVTWNIGSVTGAHVYPFGVAPSDYIPFTLNLTAGTIGNVTVSTYGTGMNNLPWPTTPDAVLNFNDQAGNNNSANAVDRFWQINKDGASGTADIIFVARTTEVGSITNLKAQRWNVPTQSWQLPSPTQSATVNSVTVNNVTTFSPWALTGNNVPLPIELISFDASLNTNRYVDLLWVTASEQNNDFFTVEKTTDGINFTTVDVVDGAGNSNNILQYGTVDTDPYQGVSYYRLKQTDFDGAYWYSHLVPIHLVQDDSFLLSLYPNPSDGTFTVYIKSETEKYRLSITDISGKTCIQQNIMMEDHESFRQFSLRNILQKGVYTLSLTAENEFHSVRLIIVE